MKTSRKSLKDLITNDAVVHFLEENHAIEDIYLGSYADMPQQEEQELINQLREQPWRDVVNDRFYESNHWLYKIITDPGRSQFLDLLMIPEDGIYLDVGSGWGQVTLPLAERGLSIALDLTKNRLDILKCIAEQEKANLAYIQGNFLTFPFQKEQMDLIVFNGSLEWIGAGKTADQTIWDCQVAALTKASTMIKRDGLVYVGIENSLGAKYLTGAKDDHTGIAHLMYLQEKEANYKYKLQEGKALPAKTWSLNEYYQLFQESNLIVEKVYGCFPDYKLIRMMIEINELNHYFTKQQYDIGEFDGSDGSPIPMDKELSGLYRTLASNGLAQYFCPSYGFVLRKKG